MSRRSEATGGRLLGTLVLFALVPAVAAGQPGSDEAEALDQWLAARRGLVELRMAHLERSVESRLPDAKRGEFAERLADLYVARLLEEDDEAEITALTRRVKELLARYPNCDSPTIRTLLLQARYTRAEEELAEWLVDPSRDDVRRRAAERFDPIARGILEQDRTLREDVERIGEELDAAVGEEEKAKEEELARVTNVRNRAAFFAAWSHYYLAATKPEASERPATTARELLRGLLAFDDDTDYAELDVGRLNLQYETSARMLLGLALVEAELGRVDDAIRLLGHLDSVEVSAGVRDTLPLWRAIVLLDAGRISDARSLVGKHVAVVSGEGTPGSTSLYTTLLHRAHLKGTGLSDEDRKSLVELAVGGLVRTGRFGVLRDLQDRYDLEAVAGAAFPLRWFNAQSKLEDVHDTEDVARLRSVALELDELSALEDAPRTPVLLAQCRYASGWCLYRGGDHLEAAKRFEQALPPLKRANSPSAAEAAWMLFNCLRQMATTNAAYAQRAETILEEFARDFPDHPRAKDVEFQKLKLRQFLAGEGDLEKALESLERTDPNYRRARYELCERYHAKARRAAADEAARAGKTLESAVETFTELEAEGVDQLRERVRAHLLVVDVSVVRNAPEAARTSLERAEQAGSALPVEDEAVGEVSYAALRVAKLAGDTDEVRTRAEWLVENRKGSKYELPALFVLVQSSEARLSAAQGDERKRVERFLRTSYGRMAEVLGDSPEALRSSPNARVVTSRAARHDAAADEHASAAARYDRLLAAFPDDVTYVRGSAVEHQAARDYETALDQWRRLVRGLEKGTDRWYEAKLGQLRCLVRLDRFGDAKTVYDDLAFLYPELGGDDWRPQFENLKKTFLAN